MCLPYQKFSDPLPLTNLFLYLAFKFDGKLHLHHRINQNQQTSWFMKLESHMSICPKTEVVIADIEGQLVLHLFFTWFRFHVNIGNHLNIPSEKRLWKQIDFIYHVLILSIPLMCSFFQVLICAYSVKSSFFQVLICVHTVKSSFFQILLCAHSVRSSLFQVLICTHTVKSSFFKVLLLAHSVKSSFFKVSPHMCAILSTPHSFKSSNVHILAVLCPHVFLYHVPNPL